MALVVLAVGLGAVARCVGCLASQVDHLQSLSRATGLVAPSGYVFFVEDAGSGPVDPAAPALVVESVRAAGGGLALTLAAP